MYQFCYLISSVMMMTTMSFAQSIDPQSVNSGGTKMTQANGALRFTVGELVVQSLTDSQGNTLSGGFNAGTSLSTLNIQEVDATLLDVKVYPNPTTELVYIQINHATIDYIVVSINDTQGKEVYCGKYAGIANTIGINTVTFTSGSYILALKNLNNKVLGTYTIIKY
jgi:hypothetical protein